jgi:hypothetical protein
MEEYIHAFLNLALDGGEYSASQHGLFALWEITPVNI